MPSDAPFIGAERRGLGAPFRALDSPGRPCLSSTVNPDHSLYIRDFNVSMKTWNPVRRGSKIDVRRSPMIFSMVGSSLFDRLFDSLFGCMFHLRPGVLT